MFRRLNAGEAVFDFIGHRKRWYWISAVLLLLCITSFVFRGFNFGIEFDGGTQFQFKATTAQPAEVDAGRRAGRGGRAEHPAGGRRRRHPIDRGQGR